MSLLMPRKLVFGAWYQEFGTYQPFIFDPKKNDAAMIPRRWDGFRSIGEIVNELLQPDYVYLFDHARQFSPMFCVSPQAMRIRLEKLGLLLREVTHQRSSPMGSDLCFEENVKCQLDKRTRGKEQLRSPSRRATLEPYRGTSKAALVRLDASNKFGLVADAIRATAADTEGDIADIEADARPAAPLTCSAPSATTATRSL
jgi:hypothetical protein